MFITMSQHGILPPNRISTISYVSLYWNNFPFFDRASKGDDDDAGEELDLYSYKWEHLTKQEQNNALHESYQFLIKKYISKEERRKMKEMKDAQAAAAQAAAAFFPEPEAVDSHIDFSHLNHWRIMYN